MTEVGAATPGFVAIYRWRVEPHFADAFIAKWEETTIALGKHGGMGSLLGRTEDGLFAAIALWPDRETRDTAFAAVGSEGWPPAERLDPILIDPLANHWRT